MSATAAAPLNNRDRAVLRAVAAGRCEVSKVSGGALVVDGRFLSDQFSGHRLAAAGLIEACPAGSPARLTASGAALLAAA
jgi:hypothetical protein